MADEDVAKKIVPEGQMCPMCRKLTFKYIEATSKLVCTSCGFESIIKKVK